MHNQSDYKSNVRSEYYEAIMQLRPNNEELIKFVLSKIKERKNVFISKSIKLKAGVDIYLSDQRFARALGKKLKRSFKGKLILSRKLHTRDRQSSKDIYRVTVCFRLSEEKQPIEINLED